MQLKLSTAHILQSILATAFVLGTFASSAQDDKLTKQVQVVRPYEPTISDAFKLNQMPRVQDTLKIVPKFTYTLASRPMIPGLRVDPITPARMVAEPQSKLRMGYVRLGIGTYTSPLAELYVNQLRSNNNVFGGWLKHKSSFGKIKLDNGVKSDADYSRTAINLFGKRIFSNSLLWGDLEYNNKGFTYYGYDTSSPTADLNNQDSKQKFNQLDAALGYHSTHTDSTHYNYAVSSNFRYFADNFSMQQNTIGINVSADKFFKAERVGLDLSIKHIAKNEKLDSINNTIIKFSPWIGLFGEQWRVKAGVQYLYDANSYQKNTFFYPIAHLSYDIISHYLIPYVEMSGRLEENSYDKILNENPWVVPGIDVFNTNHKMNLVGGVKGNFSSNVSYNAFASYSIVDSMYFYVNTSLDPANPLFNRFDVETDNVTQTRFVGELTIAASSSLSFFLKGQYQSFKMKELEKPWHKPELEGQLSVRYNLRDKILVNFDIIAEGKRFAKNADIANPITELNGLVDVNIGLQYNYNRRLGAFLDINNIAASKYSHYYLYPMQRFNIMAGVSYAF